MFTRWPTWDELACVSSGKIDIDQRHINHSLDKVVSNAPNPKILHYHQVSISRASTISDLLPLSPLLGPAELPSVLPRTLVEVHQEG